MIPDQEPTMGQEPRSSETESPSGEPLGQNRDGDVNYASSDGTDISSGTPTDDEVQGQPPIPRDAYDKGESNVGSPADDAHAR